MFDKKKINFWRLTFISAGFVVITLFLLWNSPQAPKAEMMNGSMGNMMKQMHVSNINIYDLLSPSEQSSQMSEMHTENQNQSPVIIKMNYLSTAVIFILLPFIIGGAVTLAVVWIK